MLQVDIGNTGTATGLFPLFQLPCRTFSCRAANRRNANKKKNKKKTTVKPATQAESSSTTTRATVVTDVTESEAEKLELVETMEPRMELMEDPACQPHPSTLISRFLNQFNSKVHLCSIWSWPYPPTLVQKFVFSFNNNFHKNMNFLILPSSPRLRALVWRTPCSTVWRKNELDDLHHW